MSLKQVRPLMLQTLVYSQSHGSTVSEGNKAFKTPSQPFQVSFCLGMAAAFDYALSVMPSMQLPTMQLHSQYELLGATLRSTLDWVDRIFVI